MAGGAGATGNGPGDGGGATPSGEGSPGGTGTEPESTPPGGEGGTPGTGEPLTWESLKAQGIEKPEDVLTKLQEGERWKGHARTWETRAEASAREAREAKAASLPDAEREKEKIREEARKEVMGTVGVQLAEAAFTRAATGKVASVEDALDLLAPAERDGARPDLKRYLKDDGTVDGTAIEAAVERLAKLAPPVPGKTPAPSVDRGPRTGGRPTQLTRADLQKMSPEKIMEAQRGGQLDDLLSGKLT
jgi:hypothetical protein